MRNKIRYGFGTFTLVLCLVVAIVYFSRGSQDLERSEGQVQQLKQMQKQAQLKAKAQLESKTVK